MPRGAWLRIQYITWDEVVGWSCVELVPYFDQLGKLDSKPSILSFDLHHTNHTHFPTTSAHGIWKASFTPFPSDFKRLPCTYVPGVWIFQDVPAHL